MNYQDKKISSEENINLAVEIINKDWKITIKSYGTYTNNYQELLKRFSFTESEKDEIF